MHTSQLIVAEFTERNLLRNFHIKSFQEFLSEMDLGFLVIFSGILQF